MKKELFIFILTSMMMTNVWANSNPTLQNNFCRPLVDSKKYIQNDFKAPYPKTVKFECTYECMANSETINITAVSTVRVNTIQDDAYSVVCQGVKVKKVSWGYDFDGIELFYGYDTALKEIKKFAFDHISTNNSEEIKRLTTLKTTLEQVAQSYAQAGASAGGEYAKNFGEAALILSEMAKDLPYNSQKLNLAIKQIVINKGVISQDVKAQSLVDRIIITAAAWRIPIHLF
jgi:hypothetical protein